MSIIKINKLDNLLSTPTNTSSNIQCTHIENLKALDNYKRIEDFPDYIIETYNKCNLIKSIVNKSLNENYINYYERNAILYVFGHMGYEGKQFVHFVISKCLNYNYDITEGFIGRIKEKPVSCQKLISRFSDISGKCDCHFDSHPMFYPSPVIYGYELNKTDVTKPDYIDKQERIVEILKISDELKINTLSDTLFQLCSKRSVWLSFEGL